jgi:hypothetical protein
VPGAARCGGSRATAACAHLASSHSHGVAKALPRERPHAAVNRTLASQLLTAAGGVVLARAVPLSFLYDVLLVQCRSPPAERASSPQPRRAIGLLSMAGGRAGVDVVVGRTYRRAPPDPRSRPLAAASLTTSWPSWTVWGRPGAAGCVTCGAVAVDSAASLRPSGRAVYTLQAVHTTLLPQSGRAGFVAY